MPDNSAFFEKAVGIVCKGMAAQFVSLQEMWLELERKMAAKGKHMPEGATWQGFILWVYATPSAKKRISDAKNAQGELVQHYMIQTLRAVQEDCDKHNERTEGKKGFVRKVPELTQPQIKYFEQLKWLAARSDPEKFANPGSRKSQAEGSSEGSLWEDVITRGREERGDEPLDTLIENTQRAKESIERPQGDGEDD